MYHDAQQLISQYKARALHNMPAFADDEVETPEERQRVSKFMNDEWRRWQLHRKAVDQRDRSLLHSG